MIAKKQLNEQGNQKKKLLSILNGYVENKEPKLLFFAKEGIGKVVGIRYQGIRYRVFGIG
jgi:hypothetical protein